MTESVIRRCGLKEQARLYNEVNSRPPDWFDDTLARRELRGTSLPNTTLPNTTLPGMAAATYAIRARVTCVPAGGANAG
jgi:hypothetical protein